jgi:hypothetical protein
MQLPSANANGDELCRAGTVLLPISQPGPAVLHAHTIISVLTLGGARRQMRFSCKSPEFGDLCMATILRFLILSKVSI